MFDLTKFKNWARISGDDDDTLINDLKLASDDILKSVLGLSADENIPDKPRIDLARFYLILFFYEDRAFLKEGVPSAIMKTVTGLISEERDPTKFIPGVSDE